MSNTIEIQGKIVNFQALNEILTQTLGEFFQGLSTAQDMVWVTLSEETPDNLKDSVKELVLTHDPNVLSPKQQEQLEQTERLAHLRLNVGSKVLSEAEIETLDEALRPLARKIAWLELELLALRGSLT